jgi:hypothetical protein
MNIDWTQLITKEMKDSALLAEHLAEVQAQLTARNAEAATQISRLQDRVDTLGYGIDAGEATLQDEAEQLALKDELKIWKAYKFTLGNITRQAFWPASPVWPAPPAIPDIAAVPDTNVAT